MGLAGAQHAETAAGAECLLISRLACSMVEVEAPVFAAPGSRLAQLYGTQGVAFGYHCNFGLNPAFEPALDAAGMRITARDAEGQARAIELDGHPFFVGTLFQPERGALAGRDVPIAAAFAEAARAYYTAINSGGRKEKLRGSR